MKLRKDSTDKGAGSGCPSTSCSAGLLPWIAICVEFFFFGMALAAWLMSDPEDSPYCLLVVGSTALALLMTIQCCRHSLRCHQAHLLNE